MWHRKTIRPGGASGWSGTNRRRNMESQDEPPWQSEQLLRNKSSANVGIARRSALMGRPVVKDGIAGECGIARRTALAERAAGQERTICEMWHRKTIRPDG